MDIGSINSMYTDYLASTNSESASKISKMSDDSLKMASDEKLMEACKEFESYFIEQILKQAKKAFVPESDSVDGATQTLKDYYQDSLVSEYAKSISDQQGQENSLAQMLYEQMKRNYEL